MAIQESTDSLLEKAKKAFEDDRYARACILYEKTPVQERPSEACFQLGKAYLKRKRCDQALKAFQQALDKRHSPAAVYHAMGQVKVEMGNDPDALKEFEASLNIMPKQEAVLLDTGRAHERLHAYDKAMDFYQKAAALENATIEPQLCLAHLFETRSQYVEMLQALKMAIAREPANAINAISYSGLIDALPKIADGDRDATLDAITREVLQSGNGEALLMWIEFLVDRSEPKGAKLFVEKARELWDSHQFEAYRFAQIVRKIGYSEDLGSQVGTVINDLSSPEIHAIWGRACIAAGRFEEALDQFKISLQLDREGDNIWRIAGAFSPDPSSDENAKFLGTMEQIVESMPEPWVLLTWAIILYLVGKYDQASVILERVSRLADSTSATSQLHNIWRHLLLAQEKRSEAIPHILELIRLHPGNKYEWDDLSTALSGIAQPGQWKEEVSKLLNATANPAILAKGARVLALTGDSVSAVDSFKKALKLDPRQPDAYEGLGELLLKLENKQGFIDEISALLKDTNNAVACREWGKVLDSLGLGDEAVAFLEEACKLDPDDYAATLALSALHLKGGKFERAFDLHALAAELEPEYDNVYTSWATSLAEQEKKTGVTAKLVEALGKADISTAAEIDWENIRRARDIQSREVGRFVSSVERWCDSEWAYVTCGVTINRSMAFYVNKWTERLYKGASVLNPKNFWAFFDLGLVKRDQQQYRKAQEAFTKAHDIASDTHQHFRAQIECAANLAATQKFADADLAYAKALETGIGLTGEDDIKNRIATYDRWAQLLSNMKLFDRALDASRTALSLAPEDYWAHFRLAYTYGEMMEYDRCIHAYERAIEIDPTQPYAMHNITDTWEKQALYRMARIKWAETLKVYQAGLTKAVQALDADYCFYYGAVMNVLGYYDRAESLFRTAEILNPDRADIQHSLLDLYMELTKRARTAASLKSDVSAAQPETLPGFHWRCQKAYETAKRILNERLSDDRDAQTLLELGALELLKGEYEAAATALKEAAGKNPSAGMIHQKLGEAYLAQGRYPDAIACLDRALTFQPGDLALRTVLGRAYLRSGKLDEAEKVFLGVTDAARFHVDAWIGLGEVYLEMVENKAAKDTARMDEWYDRAIEALVRGIDIAGSPDRPITLTAEMDTAHYLLGYARIQLYESSRLLRDIRMVGKARADFQKCLEVNPNYTKARRALQRIKEQKGQGRTTVERIGPYLLILLSFLLIYISLFGLFKGLVSKEAGLALKPSSITALKDLGLKQDQLDQLKREMTDARFASEQILIDKIREILGADMSDKVVISVKKGITSLPAERQYFKFTEFTVLVFGGILFLIAGLYLPQLTSLKLPGLQLDKSASERVEPIRSLGISK